MTAPAPRPALSRALLSALALLGATAAQADNASDLDARAAAAYNAGLDARAAGDRAAACQHFRNAATLYENSIYALMSRSMASDEDRDFIKTAAGQQQAQADKAKAQARTVC